MAACEIAGPFDGHVGLSVMHVKANGCCGRFLFPREFSSYKSPSPPPPPPPPPSNCIPQGYAAFVHLLGILLSV